MSTRRKKACSKCLKADCDCLKQSTHAKTLTGEYRYNYAWRKYAKQYIIDNPLCKSCLAAGATSLSRVVDHIEPVRQAPERFWEPANHQALCIYCHNRKTAQGK